MVQAFVIGKQVRSRIFRRSSQLAPVFHDAPTTSQSVTASLQAALLSRSRELSTSQSVNYDDIVSAEHLTEQVNDVTEMKVIAMDSGGHLGGRPSSHSANARRKMSRDNLHGEWLKRRRSD